MVWPGASPAVKAAGGRCVCDTQLSCKYANEQTGFSYSALVHPLLQSPEISACLLSIAELWSTGQPGDNNRRQSSTCTGRKQHLYQAFLELRPGTFVDVENCLISFHHCRQTGATTCSSSRASLFVVASGLVSPSISSRSVMLASLRRKTEHVQG